MVSDFACPWCFVGKRRLKKAIEQRPDLDIALNWRPFQLNPDMPREGRNRRDYYRNKFGDERAKDLRETLKNAGAEAGIVFCDEPDAMAPNTLSAHVLMFWAANDKNIDTNALAEKLFNANHVACENIGDNDLLMRIAGDRENRSRTVISSISGIFTRKPGKSGKIVLDGSYPKNQKTSRGGFDDRRNQLFPRTGKLPEKEKSR